MKEEHDFNEPRTPKPPKPISKYPRFLIPKGQIIGSDYMKAARKKAGITGSRRSKAWRRANQMPKNVAIVGHVVKT